MPIIVALVSGILFGLGLLLAGMGNPAKILAFLDITGNWDCCRVFQEVLLFLS